MMQNIRINRHILFLMATPLFAGCEPAPPPQAVQLPKLTQEIAMPSVINEKLQRPSPDNDFSIEEINLLSNIIRAVSRVMSQEILEITSEPMLNDVRYQSPKDIRKPIDYADGGKDLEGLDRDGFARSYGYAFRRIDNTTAWTDGRIGIYSGIGMARHTLNLTQDFFLNELGLVFDNAQFSNDPPDPWPGGRHVFYFHSADNKLKYAFYARANNSNIKDGYPKNFFDLKITTQ